MPEETQGLWGVGGVDYEELPLSESFAWLKHRIGKFVKGGTYLLAGQPGIGKSTLGIQLAIDLGRTGQKTLYVLTEVSKADLAKRAQLMVSNLSENDAKSALSCIESEENLYDLESLPNFLSKQVLGPSGRYHGSKLIIVDSVQGQGLASTATKTYRQVYEFCRQCKAAGITVLLIAHVTKRGDIAGPKDLEHNVDCVLVMRKAMAYRPLFVPKNRFGPAVLKPVPLEMDKITTALKLAAHSAAVSTVARSFLGKAYGLPEVQAAVSLPSYGTRGRIIAPQLPRKEIEQLANCINQIPDMDIGDLDYTIHCRLPGGRRYNAILGLPLAMALIASYIQKDIPAHHIYMGEIDLLRKVRGVSDDVLLELMEEIEAGNISKPIRIFLPKEQAEVMRRLSGVTVSPCTYLEDAVFDTWPDLRPEK